MPHAVAAFLHKLAVVKMHRPAPAREPLNHGHQVRRR